MYSNFCFSCSFDPEIIKIGQSSHNILNSQESMTILNACTKKLWKHIEGTTYVLQISIDQIKDNGFAFKKDRKWKISRKNYYADYAGELTLLATSFAQAESLRPILEQAVRGIGLCVT